MVCALHKNTGTDMKIDRNELEIDRNRGTDLKLTGTDLKSNESRNGLLMN